MSPITDIRVYAQNADEFVLVANNGTMDNRTETIKIIAINGQLQNNGPVDDDSYSVRYTEQSGTHLTENNMRFAGNNGVNYTFLKP